MDASSYLERIGYSGTPRLDRDTLGALQTAHMLNVPFENLDIVPLHRPISLDESALWDKIAVRRRGGFCYELNGMFAWLLRQLGFEVTYLNGRVVGRDGNLGMDFDHLAMLVGVPGDTQRWLTDVGFGDSFSTPLDFREAEQPQGLRAYRLEPRGEGHILWQRDYDGNWQRQYWFDLLPRSFPSDYESACAYNAGSPRSHFTQKSIVSKMTPQGRISLEKDRLIITEAGRRREQPGPPAPWAAMLREHVGSVL